MPWVRRIMVAPLASGLPGSRVARPSVV